MIDPAVVAMLVSLAGAEKGGAPAILDEAPKKKETSFSLGPLILGGAGVAATIVGSVFVRRAQGHRNEILEAPREDGVIVGLTMRNALDLEDQAGGEARTGAILFGLGSAALLGGIVWWIIEVALED